MSHNNTSPYTPPKRPSAPESIANDSPGVNCVVHTSKQGSGFAVPSSHTSSSSSGSCKVHTRRRTWSHRRHVDARIQVRHRRGIGPTCSASSKPSIAREESLEQGRSLVANARSFFAFPGSRRFVTRAPARREVFPPPKAFQHLLAAPQRTRCGARALARNARASSPCRRVFGLVWTQHRVPFSFLSRKGRSVLSRRFKSNV